MPKEGPKLNSHSKRRSKGMAVCYLTHLKDELGVNVQGDCTVGSMRGVAYHVQRVGSP